MSAEAIDFARVVRPIFQKHCTDCHGGSKQKSGFRLDLRAAAMKGGTSGVAIVPGKSGESPLIEYVTAPADDDLRMPPKGEGLSAMEVATLKRWIDAGARWPDRFAGEDKRLKHWAWQPIGSISPPAASDDVGNPIDHFVQAKLRDQGLSLSPPADARTLIRRLSYDLHGLPPTPEAVRSFLKDQRPDAYERLVDQLLASPHFGERFARHWLDIAHYADTHGFERDKRRPNAWRYRDYLIDAFNNDLPYDRFLQEQIAGDVLWPDSARAVIATGFLAAGPWDFVGQVETKSPTLRRAARSLDLDDMATQVMTATTAITINCARCHDHKLDPISQEEYYQLRAVFAGVRRADRSVISADHKQSLARRRDLFKQIAKLEPSLDLADIVGGGTGAGDGVKGQGIDPRNGKPESRRMGYLSDVKPNQFAASKNPLIDGVFIPRGDAGKASVPVSSTGLSAIGIRNGDAGGKVAAWDVIRNGPVNSTHSTKLAGIDFNADGNRLLGLHANAGIAFDLTAIRRINDADAMRFTAQVGYFGMDRPGLFADAWVLLDGKAVAHFTKLRRASGLKAIDITLPQAARFLTLIATDGGNGISHDQIGFGNPRLIVSRELIHGQQAQLRALRAELKTLDERIAKSGPMKVYAVVGQKTVPDVRVLRRGEADSPTGEPLAPGAPAMLAMLNPALGGRTSAEGQRRAALARWITDRRNPLTRRVIVNRFWHWLFGQGIVETPSDFGFGGAKPSHPQLLDYLADELMRKNGSLKAVIRLILTSETYRQQSRRDDRSRPRAIDAGNRLLWRQNPTRIEAEAIRDAVLAVSGKLNLQRGGPGFEDFKYQEAYAPIYTYVTADEPSLWRRSIYRYIVRTTPDRFMTTLDCPDPAILTARRLTTTTPLQSLALYNNDFMLRQSRYFAQRLEREAGRDPAAQVRRAFALAFSRRPSSEETQLSIAVIREHGLFTFCRSIFNANEFVYVD